MVQAIQDLDWLSLGWVGFISALATLGLGAIAKELWKLRRLRQHFSVQEQAQILMENDAVCQGQAFCEQIAKQGKVDKQGYQRWLSALNSSHSDAEILDLYDALVVGEQDKQASQIVTFLIFCWWLGVTFPWWINWQKCMALNSVTGHA